MDRINSHTDLNRIDETRRNITKEDGDLLVNDRNIDRQTHTHHIVTGENAKPKVAEFFSGHVTIHLEPTQPQQMIGQLSRDITLPVLENAYKRVQND